MGSRTSRLLIADDDANLRTVLAGELCSTGCEVAETNSGEEALSLLEKEEFDVLLLDLNMPGRSGIDVLKQLKTVDSPVQVIILTGHGTVSAAVEAMKLGAYDFLTKPFKMDELRAVVAKAYEKKKLLNENLLLKSRINRQHVPSEIVTQSPLMLDILETAKKVAASGLPVLIYGESGTGKELVARSVHDASGRAEGAFLPVNCGAIPETILESELFGHEKGAFTGAHAKKPGLLEIADNGTLFLDEIGELPLPLQVKLLRAIETGKFFRVGGVKEIGVDVKFVAATNKDLKREVDTGAFRADLYYRVSALTVRIPPLRERKEDIPLLIEHFKRNHPAFRSKRFTPGALAALGRYAWPGNVRELQNMVHRILLLASDDIIEACTLPPDINDCRPDRSMRLADVERGHILAVLRDAEGQRGRAAELLGIDPKTLYRKLREYGVS